MAKADTAPRLADTPEAWEPDVEAASYQVGPEWLRATFQRTKRRARGIGKRSGFTCMISFWFATADGELKPSKFGRAMPSADARLLPLLARVALDAAAFAEREGLLRAEDWERAGLPPPDGGADA
jgi:hypothetical protein